MLLSSFPEGCCHEVYLTNEGRRLRPSLCPRPHTMASVWMRTPISLTTEPMLFTRHELTGFTGIDHRVSWCLACYCLIFLSISVSSWEVEVAGIPKMHFHSILEKEASIFTAEHAFLFPLAAPGQAFLWTLCKMYEPTRCLPEPASRDAEQLRWTWGRTQHWLFVSVRFPGTFIWGRGVLDGCR